jgi:hypothetical protein
MTDNLLPSSSIVIKRSSRGILKRTAAEILINCRIVSFYADDKKEFTVSPGVVTLLINNRKLLPFRIGANEVKEFVINESINDWRFYLKYGLLILLIAGILYSTISQRNDGSISGGVLVGLILLIWGLKELRSDYFFIEESEG